MWDLEPRLDAVERVAPPIFREELLLMILFMILVIGLLYAAVPTKDRSTLLANSFTRFDERLTQRLSWQSYLFLFCSILFGAFWFALFVTLTTLDSWQGISMPVIWDRTLHYTLITIVAYTLTTLSYLLLWLILTPREECQLWLTSYFVFSTFFSHLLIIPILISLLIEQSNGISVTMVIILFLLSRILLLFRSLQIFRRLRRLPLHIFLYLCAGELAPLYYIWRWSAL